jgi:hypothetical protein
MIENKKLLSINFLVGFFETDGCFQIVFKKQESMSFGYQISLVATFSQSLHYPLECVSYTLTHYNIVNRWQDNSKSNQKRASAIKFEGITNMRNFIKLLAVSC